MTVIPDSITPVEGWKAWTLLADGRLASRGGGFLWMPGERAEAACSNPPVHIGWELDREADGSEIPAFSDDFVYGPAVAYSAVPYTAHAVSIRPSAGATGPTGATGAVPGPQPLPEPALIPPPGKRWYFRRRVLFHTAPNENCSCGIYMADSRYEAENYGTVVGKIAGWGNVVEHGSGHRVQYAYPTELYVSAEHAEMILDYGVPLVLTDEPTTYAARVEREVSAHRTSVQHASAFVLSVATIVNLGLAAVFGAWPNAIAASISAFVAGMLFRAARKES